ncbi:MAG: membrane protein insertion efficiency factor YidD [Candidatus Eremiobacteraeota bacterium]|nr:membrane protein insertion efficiency factor YidD [Candidatus Eremiobacteraeota bacterium]
MSGRIARAGILVYKRYISAEYNSSRHSHCMYSQSCSAYASQAFQEKPASQALADTLARLVACTEPVRETASKEFEQALDQTEPEALDRHFHFEQPDARRLLLEVKAGRRESLQQLEVHLHSHFGEAAGQRFDIGLAHQHPPLAQPRGLARVLWPVAGLFTGLAGGLCGGLAGIVGGAWLGARTGFVAGSGRLDQWHQQLADRYGADTLRGVEAIEKPVIARLDQMGRNCPAALRWASGCLGGLTGFAAGLGLGSVGGAVAGFEMGRCLGHGLIREHLKA